MGRMNRKLTPYIALILLLMTSLVVAKSIIIEKHHTEKKNPVNVILTGVEDVTVLKNINSAVTNVKASYLTTPVTNNSVSSVYYHLPKAIQDALEPYGYFNSTVQVRETANKQGWTLFVTIHPGVQSMISDVTVTIRGEGNKDPEFLRVLQHYPLKKGQAFSLVNYNDANDLLFQHAANIGYFDAIMVQNKIYVDLRNNTVKIAFQFNTGTRYRFGQTLFSTTPFDQKFLQKYLAYKEGENYSNSLVSQTQNNLSNSPYFSQVVVSPLTDQADHFATPMNISLTTQKRQQYTFGLGYGTDTQLRGTAAFKYNWVNSWGNYVDAKLQGSFIQNSFSAGYHMPWPDPAKDLFSVDGGIGELDLSSIGNSFSEKLWLEYKHTFGDWSQTFSLNYLNERYNILNLPNTDDQLIYPNEEIAYYSTKNRINPDNALSFIANFSGTPSALAVTSGFFQMKLSSKNIITFFDREQFVTRLTYAKTTIDNINQLPLSLQLLAGGTGSIRGYNFDEIGPGKQMLVGSEEFRQRIYKEFYLSGFIDYGNVADNNLFQNFYATSGPGIVYRSIIGVIELNAVWRLTQNKKMPGVVFSMGPEL